MADVGCRWRSAAGLVLSVGLLAACTTAPGLPPLNDPRMASLPSVETVDAVPFFPQADYYCGPAALGMVLAWSGLDVTQADLVPVVYTPGRQGTLQADILAAARRFGRLAVPIRTIPDLLAELAAGHPVLVFQNLSLPIYPQWHYAVATGFDLEAGTIRLHSGRTENLETRLSTFTRSWARGDYWALVVLPPDQLPATAAERPVLEAAAALERAGQFVAAADAFAAILTRWPSSLPAWIGLGNAAYATNDKRRAVAAFARATDHHPGSAAAWQNLAFVLDELGRTTAAAQAAARARALGAAPGES